MSNTASSYNWFWNGIDPQTAASLSDKQRAEIDRVLVNKSASAASKDTSDIRLTFGWHYLVIRWGNENRGRQRLKVERKKHPVLTKVNMPVILAFWVPLFLGVYATLAIGMRGLVYLLG
ncbi:MAG: hypothetical protein GY927_09525 [bacterium]|nr:hypothetical protein [bacterium]